MKKIFLVAALILTATTVTVFARALFDTPYIGNKYRMTLHLRNCKSVDQMNPKNQVPIKSLEEAKQKGYHPCGNCRPDLNR